MTRYAPSTIDEWFQQHDWNPFAFQRQTWSAYLAGQSGLVHAPTGMGKTLAVWLGPLQEWLTEHGTDRTHWPSEAEPIRLLWLTPLRALANDSLEALRWPIAEMNIPWTVGARTGDTSASQKAKQRERLPSALITTPESLSLLLSYPGAEALFASLRCVVVDEWHELLSSKRGVQTELCLARLRRWHPRLRTWGLSATLGNSQEAAEVLCGTASSPVLIRGEERKQVVIETMLPAERDQFPWAGHHGLVNAEQVAREIDSTESCLLFTNTRSQAELWYQALSEVRPAWHGCLALHHGSLSREEREAAEAGLQSGALRCVVCTSSLDLGVDFSPVDLVVQIGSPKGVGRLLQRAGRSGHRPGAISRVLCVPTNAFELVEFSAAREAAEARQVEPRIPLEKPLDLLVQHLLTIGLGGGFTREEVLGEVQGAWAFRNLTDQELGWALDFLTHGGPALKAYPQYARLGLLRGRYVPVSDQTGKSHRLSIGTITSDSSIAIRFQRGATLGAVEEYFIARLKPGDRFLFAGRPLELIGVRGMVAEVRRATGKATAVPQWMGGKMPLSTLLADRVRGRLHAAREGSAIDREMEWVTPIIAAQEKLSHLPAPGELLIETVRTREGHHAFLFAFAGRAVHEGLGALIAHRLTQQNPRSISIMVNDYGLQLLSSKPLDFSETEWREVLASDRLHEDLLRCMNTTELAKRRFRDVARVAGLIIEGFPGTRKSTKQLQISSSLLFDVFSQFDPGNMLLEQARREVLRDQLDVRQMEACLTRLEGEQLVLKTPKRLAPMAFPLWAESIRTHVSNETWEEKVAGMLQQMDEALR